MWEDEFGRSEMVAAPLIPDTFTCTDVQALNAGRAWSAHANATRILPFHRRALSRWSGWSPTEATHSRINTLVAQALAAADAIIMNVRDADVRGLGVNAFCVSFTNPVASQLAAAAVCDTPVAARLATYARSPSTHEVVAMTLHGVGALGAANCSAHLSGAAPSTAAGAWRPFPALSVHLSYLGAIIQKVRWTVLFVVGFWLTAFSPQLHQKTYTRERCAAGHHGGQRCAEHVAPRHACGLDAWWPSIPNCVLVGVRGAALAVLCAQSVVHWQFRGSVRHRTGDADLQPGLQVGADAPGDSCLCIVRRIVRCVHPLCHTRT